MNERARKLLLVLTMFSALACSDGLGRALVGELPTASTDNLCWQQIECTPVGDSFVPLREAVPAPAIGSNCALLDTNVVDSNLPLTLRCARWNLTLAPEQPRAVSGLTTQFSELHFTAERPTRVTLTAANLSDTLIVMHGPVTLRIEPGAELRNVQLLDDGSGQASLELVESSAHGLVLGDAAQDFTGLAVVTRSMLFGARLMARSLRLENSELSDLIAVTEDLVMQTVQGAKMRLDFERATLGGATLTDLTVQRCGDLQITNSMLAKVVIVPCTTGMHIDRSNVVAGALAGRITSKVTNFRELSFGAGSLTEIELWSGSFISNALCDGVQRLAVSGVAQCNQCPALGTSSAPFICRTETSSDEAALEEPLAYELGRNPACPALELAVPCQPAPKDDYPF